MLTTLSIAAVAALCNDHANGGRLCRADDAS